jgi:hypothetical protein
MIEMRWLRRPYGFEDVDLALANSALPGVLQWREVRPRREGPDAPVMVIRDWMDVPVIDEEDHSHATTDSE